MKQGDFKSVIYKNKIDTIYNVVNNKGFNINNQMFDIAFNLYKRNFCTVHNIEESYFDEIFNIIKIPNESYDLPCSIIQRNISNDRKFNLEYKVDLTPFWPEYNYTSKQNDVININTDENFGEDKVEYIDYVRGIAIVFNSYTGLRKTIPISSITAETKITDRMKITNYGRK